MNENGFPSDTYYLTDDPRVEDEPNVSWEKAKHTTSGVTYLDQKEQLKDRLRGLEEEERLEELRAKIRAKEDSLLKLRRESVQLKSTPKQKGNLFTVDNLRNEPNLLNQARKKLRHLGLVDVSGTEEESDDDSDESEHVSVKHCKSGCRAKKSGLKAKASDSVIHPQKYPHAIEIISKHLLPAKEKSARLELLKSLMYLNKSVDFKVIKSLYAAILREVELGYIKWGDDFNYIENTVLASSYNKYSFMPKSDFSQGAKSHKSEGKKWFCSQFQRNK